MKLTNIVLPLMIVLSASNAALSATMTYGSVGIIADSEVARRYEIALQACAREASTPPRGYPRDDNFYHRTALKACLYRQGFAEDGSHAYPVPLFGSPGIHR